MKKDLRKFIIKLLIFIITIEVLLNYNGVFIIIGEELTNDTSNVILQEQYTITEKYQSLNGVSIADDTISTVNAGEDYIKQPPNLGYPISYILIDGDLYESEINDNNDDFLPGSIGVVIKKSLSEVNKEWNATDFPEIDIESIEDETKITGNISDTLLNLENFHQILNITLKDKSKEGVLRAINQLQNNPNIEYVGPNYIIHGDSVPSFIPVKIENVNSDHEVIFVYDFIYGRYN